MNPHRAPEVKLLCPHCSGALYVKLAQPITPQRQQKAIKEAVDEHRRLCAKAPPEAKRVYEIHLPACLIASPTKRTKGPASTPAQRLVELQTGASTRRKARRDEALRPQINALRGQADRYHRMADTSFGGITMAQIRCDLTAVGGRAQQQPAVRRDLRDRHLARRVLVVAVGAGTSPRHVLPDLRRDRPGTDLPPDAFLRRSTCSPKPKHLGEKFRIVRAVRRVLRRRQQTTGTSHRSAGELT